MQFSMVAAGPLIVQYQPIARSTAKCHDLSRRQPHEGRIPGQFPDEDRGVSAAGVGILISHTIIMPDWAFGRDPGR